MRRVVGTNEGREVWQFVQAVDIANRAVVDDAIPRTRIDGVAHVVTDRWPILLEPEVVGHIDIARLQHVHRPCVRGSLAIILCALIFDHLLNVGSSRHPHRRECPAHQHLVGMDTIPAVFILVVEARGTERGPRLFKGDILHAIEDVVGHLGPAVGKPVSMPVGRVLDDVVSA